MHFDIPLRADQNFRLEQLPNSEILPEECVLCHRIGTVLETLYCVLSVSKVLMLQFFQTSVTLKHREMRQICTE